MSIHTSRLEPAVSAAEIPKYHPWHWDKVLAFSLILLIGMGIIMVTSASMPIAEKNIGQPFYFALRQIIFLSVGIVGSILVLRIPIDYWKNMAFIGLLIAFFLLIVVLIPFIGKTVNGSTRWIGFGSINIQVSEPAKLLLFFYLARYLDKHRESLVNSWLTFIKPVALMFLASVLLLLEPDMGSAVVLISTTLGVLFLAGARLAPFLILILIGTGLFATLVITSPYRLERVRSFLNPWLDPLDSGYQLIQALIAIGNGGIIGRGLGESIQKLHYLPEAHTDFIFSVLAEELGLIGVIALLILYSIILWRALRIAMFADALGHYFSAYLANAIALWIGLQFVINLGVNMGLLPTKGLTLPFLSYGGSSLVVMCIAAALLLRIHHENQKAYQKRLVRRARS